MTWSWLPWCLGMLGVSIVIAWIGWLLSPIRSFQADMEKYWKKMKEDHIYYAEHVYCRK